LPTARPFFEGRAALVREAGNDLRRASRNMPFTRLLREPGNHFQVLEPIGSIKGRLVLALGAVQLATLVMALVLYVGARRLDASAHATRRANDEVRELLSFALTAHRYMNAVEASLGQRTLIANHERRAAAAAFQSRLSGIDQARLAHPDWGALDWNELKSISTELSGELQKADALRERGRFYDAERVFAAARKTQFDQGLLVWFDRAIELQHANVDRLESDATGYAASLREAGTIVACISAVLAAVAVLAVSRSILRPVSALIAGTEAIAQGDLRHRVEVWGRDELTLLADRFNQMAAALARAQTDLVERNDRLEEAYKLQSEFLSMVSHELRSPLHSILGYTELVLEDGGFAPQTRSNVETIALGAQRLLSLINDILDFSKLKAGHMEARLSEFDLRPVLEGVTNDARALVRRPELQVVLNAPNVPLSVHSDEARVRQILTNLLSNAVKFTDRGKVSLRAGLVSGGVELEVSDTGIGIPSDQIGIIFEPFRQASAASDRAGGGTGLGLAIVARLVKLLGGRIDVQSEPGMGTHFIVFLPSAI
jgi:signal transduction histidine kinase